MRTIIVNRDGLDYIEVATQKTRRQKLAEFASAAAKQIDKVLFYGADINNLPAPRKEVH